MAKWRRFWIVLPTSLIILTIGVLVWNSSLSGIDPDPPPIVHRDPPEGVETKSKRHPPETVIIENVTGEVKRGFVNTTDAQSGN